MHGTGSTWWQRVCSKRAAPSAARWRWQWVRPVSTTSCLTLRRWRRTWRWWVAIHGVVVHAQGQSEVRSRYAAIFFSSRENSRMDAGCSKSQFGGGEISNQKKRRKNGNKVTVQEPLCL